MILLKLNSGRKKVFLLTECFNYSLTLLSVPNKIRLFKKLKAIENDKSLSL